MKKIVEVLANREELINRSLGIVLSKIHSAIAERGVCTIAAAGGSTPEPLYRALCAQDLPWDKIHVFWGDERYVPPEHPDSNQKMARLAWLERVNIPASNIHPMPTGAGDPQPTPRRTKSNCSSSSKYPMASFLLSTSFYWA